MQKIYKPHPSTETKNVQEGAAFLWKDRPFIDFTLQNSHEAGEHIAF